MNGFGRWAFGHLTMAMPTIAVIAIVKFIFSHNKTLSTFREDF